MKERVRISLLLGVLSALLFVVADAGRTDAYGAVQAVLAVFSVAMFAAALWFSKRSLH